HHEHQDQGQQAHQAAGRVGSARCLGVGIGNQHVGNSGLAKKAFDYSSSRGSARPGETPARAVGSVRAGGTLAAEALYVGREGAGGDGLAQLGRQRLVVAQVVHRVEHAGEDFAGAVQVVQVGTTEVTAGVAVAAWVERPGVGLVGRV